MAGKNRLSFHLRMVLTVLLTCWVVVGVFMMFQYRREKEFKASLLDTRLQMHNARLLEDMRRGEAIGDIVARIDAPVPNLRVTLIDRDGRVVYDNHGAYGGGDHNSRPEVRQARGHGEGHALERVSESDRVSYFYSATLGPDGVVIRSAAPYTHTLTEFLRADRNILWLMGALTLAMSLLALLATRKISVSIRRLNTFAARAEKGGRIYDDYAFPNDELGSIAGHIVRLYVQRDEQHRLAMRQEQDKIRLKKQLTNNINHELKTPVASILVSLELLRDHPELPPQKKDRLMDRIEANARRLSALLKDVSTITRMDEGKAAIDRRPVDLAALINEIADEARLRTDMRINVSVPPITVNGDRYLLESVFRNLVDNAIAYSGGTRIDITADADGNFTVSDDGRGVAAEHLPHLFERFYRVDDGRARASGGTGLGLSIVRNAVAIHGGQIRVTSGGDGLRFDFRLKPV